MELQTGKKYKTADGTYEVTVKSIVNGKIICTYVAFSNKNNKGESSSWGLDGIHRASSAYNLVEIVPFVGLCQCAWNKHPLFCRCK